MDDLVCNRVLPVVKKAKKKQKNDVDQLKRAEKKRRRLEKALATSAAIRSELEKKKQSKKEEQQKLDEEGAAIAEAVALHVLLGEDADETCNVVGNRDDSRGKFFMSSQRESVPCWKGPPCSPANFVWAGNAYGSYLMWGASLEFDDWTYSLENSKDCVCKPEHKSSGWGSPGSSAGSMAADAVSSLQIAEDAWG